MSSKPTVLNFIVFTGKLRMERKAVLRPLTIITVNS